jgi:hypothetical protein
MNTDHINYQQQLTQSVIEDKDQELFERASETPKGQFSTSASSTVLNANTTSINGHYQRINDGLSHQSTMQTVNERHEHLLSLFVIALIAFLTGNIDEHRLLH